MDEITGERADISDFTRLNDVQIPTSSAVDESPKDKPTASELTKRQQLTEKLQMLQKEERSLQSLMVHMRSHHSRLTIEKVRLEELSKKLIGSAQEPDDDEYAEEEDEEEESTSDDESDTGEMDSEVDVVGSESVGNSKNSQNPSEK